MYIASNSNTKSSFSNEWIQATKESGRFTTCEWDKTQKMKLTTLDNLISDFGEPDFIKIDVEGFELEVLKGLSQPLKMLSLEYTVPEQTKNLISCMNRLNDIYIGHIECNYSTGESMEWAQENWMSIAEMKEFVTSPKFINTHFGDVYIRHKN